MYSTYRLKAEDLSETLLNAIKSTYHDRQIEITVQEVEDETDYLLSSPANSAHLLSAIKNIENNSNLVDVPLESI
jgi:antitoxin YefM